MTKDATKEAIAVMQAYVDGKRIEYHHRYAILKNGETRDPNWDWVEFDYRIAPDPKYRPYATGENASSQLIGKRIRNKSTDTVWIVFGAESRGLIPSVVYVQIAHPSQQGKWVDAASLLSDYEFLDGKPCGVLEGGAK